MHRAFISELEGKQCVVVRGLGRPQVYVCLSLEHAKKFLLLMDTPERARRAPAVASGLLSAPAGA